MPQGQRNSRTTRRQDTPPLGPNEMGKLPPQALDVERHVLGACMIEKEAYGSIASMLRPESFYEKKHQLIYDAFVHLASKNAPIDMLTVIEQLKADGSYQEAGEAVYISELTMNTVSAAHIQFHAQIVARKATARDLITISNQTLQNAYDDTLDIDEVMQAAEGSIFEISQRAQKRDATQIDPVINEAFARMRKAAENSDNISGVPSGYFELDKVTSGWQKSDLIIIAARPAMGKTAFVLSMAKNMAVNFKRPVAMFSLEMSNVQLVNRLIQNVCEIEGSKIRNGRLSQQEWHQMENRINQLYSAPIYVDDTPSLSVFELRSKARKLVREHKVECIIIDYLQLMNASGMNFGSREQEISTISRNLKALAKELDIPIIALSQLSRKVEDRGTGAEGKIPQLSDLRESGAIEQDADMVCFIHRPDYYFRQGPSSEGYDPKLVGKGNIIVAKHRNGATKTVTLRFRAEFARFENDTPEDEAPTTMDGAQLDGSVTIASSWNSGATLSSNTLPQSNDMPF